MIENTTPVSSAASASTTQTQKNAASSEVSKDTFIQLLVAQIKNQDPLNPTDGVQFLTQLAQFTQLEQSMDMRSELTRIRTAIEAMQTAATAPDTTGANQNV